MDKKTSMWLVKKYNYRGEDGFKDQDKLFEATIRLFYTDCKHPLYEKVTKVTETICH